MMRFGANSFIWLSPFRTEPNMGLALLPKVRGMSFDIFEVACEDPALIEVAALKAALEAQRLGAIVCGVYGPDRDLSSANPAIRSASLAYTRWLIDTAQALGAPVVGGPIYTSVGKPHPDTEAEFANEHARAIDGLRELADYAGSRGVRLAIEALNRFETDLVNTAEQALEMVEKVGSPHLGLHLDTFHMHLEEKNLESAIRAAGPRLYHFHACENDRGVPGTGQVNWEGAARSLTAIGYSGAVVIESFTPQVKAIAQAVRIWRKIAPDQDTIARDGLAFLRKLFASVPEGTR